MHNISIVTLATNLIAVFECKNTTEVLKQSLKETKDS